MMTTLPASLSLIFLLYLTAQILQQINVNKLEKTLSKMVTATGKMTQEDPKGPYFHRRFSFRLTLLEKTHFTYNMASPHKTYTSE